MSEDMKEKIARLGWHATCDFRDYWKKKERLRNTGAIYGDKPENLSEEPLISERYLLETWKLVFAILLDTAPWDVEFTYNNDFERCEIRVNNECLFSMGRKLWR